MHVYACIPVKALDERARWFHLQMWIFDQSDGGGRLFKLQQGHSGAPCHVRFHGATGTNILSAGLDSTLRSFSTLGENLNKNLGQASFNRKKAKKLGILKDPGKMPPICEFTSETTREKEWDSIAACHRGVKKVTTWSYDRCCMGKHQLLHKRFEGVRGISALCVSLSACGNFVTIGYSSGHVDRFNIQSGIHRMTYGKELGEEVVDRYFAPVSWCLFVGRENGSRRIGDLSTGNTPDRKSVV